jgi:hypothetical protein
VEWSGGFQASRITISRRRKMNRPSVSQSSKDNAICPKPMEEEEG